MSSSINPPIASGTKFNFDLDFEVEDERLRLEMLRQEELRRQAELNPAPQLLYTENDLESAKAEAFQRGQTHGLDESKKALEKVLVDLVDRALQVVHSLLQQETQRDVVAKEIALKSSLSVIRRFWPQLLQMHSLETIERTLRDTLATNNDETRIVLRVHDSLLDSVIQRLPHIKEQEAFNGKIIVIADDAVLPGDCKVEWADGGLEKLGQSLSIKLEEVFTRLISAEKLSGEISHEQERI
jgi:flagellar assembly protein FliH